MFENCPQFTMLELVTENDRVFAHGRLSTVNGAHERWIKERWLGYLVKGRQFIEGRWFEAGELWKFNIFDPEENLQFLEVGDTVAAVDGYWGERARMVLGDGFEFKKIRYVAPPHDDHDHCYFCFKTISEHENIEHYSAGGCYVLCIECYERTVARRDISSLHPCFRSEK